MSGFTWPIRLASLDGEQSLDIDTFVDTGAFMTTVAATMLKQLGVGPVARQQFALADGRRTRRDIGYVIATIGDQCLIAYVAFGDEDSPILLGTLAL